MPQSGFVHLHAHSVYSLLDGHSRLATMVAKASELGMPALALTDHGVMYGSLDFYLEARRAGIKPIIGCELYVAPRTMGDREFGKDTNPYHLTVLAETTEGYQNLMRLVSAAHLEGMYYKPRVDKDLLARHSAGLIALSGCLSAEVPRLILEDNLAGARQAVSDYSEIFGRDNFFMEIQDQQIPEEVRSNAGLVALSREFNLPLVATNDIHYVDRGDAFSHDVLLCIQTASSISQPNRMKFSTEEFYMKSAEEMGQLFRDHPDSLRRTLEIAERCNVEIPLDQSRLPRFDLPEGETADTYLRRLAEEGVGRRYGVVTEEIRERLENELSLIHDMGFAAYFLIVWDFIRFARETGVPVGPGRGSATGSMVAYALGITALDPLRYGLIFERFLNRERISMPDIDIDFSKAGRESVIRYVTEKYGADRVAQIVTYQRQMSRQAIRDVARVLEVPAEDAMRVTNLVRSTQGKPHSIEQELRDNPEFRTLVHSSEQYRRVVEISRGLEGVARNAGVHAAGVVIAPEPLVNFAPLARVPRAKDSEGGVMTQYDMKGVQRIGLLKMDFLGLRNLDIIQTCLRYIEETTGERLDIDTIPLDDASTFELLSRADTLGTFQMEGAGMRRLLEQMRPSRFEDVIVAISLFRPGAMDYIPDYCQRKHGQAPIHYMTPDLEPILEPTYGVIVYQEQVMEIAVRLAGFSMGQADVLRAAMGKKDRDKMATMRQQFLEGAQSRGIELKVAEDVYEAIEKFAGYGFNKSHAAAYGLISYQTAYLKSRYPLQYMAALLTNHMGETEKVAAIIVDTRAREIEVLPPDIQGSRRDFTIDGDRLLFGLRGIKNVGDRAIELLVAERDRNGPFKSFQDLCRRVPNQELNRRALEALVKCGACDSLGERAVLLASIEAVTESVAREQRDLASGQVGLFAVLGAGLESWQETPLATATAPATPEEKLSWEKELVGLYISDHPLRRVEARMRECTDTLVVDLGPELEGQVVRLGGMVRSVRTKVTRKQDVMAFVELEDLTGTVELVLFPRTYEGSRHLLLPDALLIVEGAVEVRSGGGQQRSPEAEDDGVPERVAIRADVVWGHEDPGARDQMGSVRILHVDIPAGADAALIAGITGLLREFPGQDRVEIHLDLGDQWVSVGREDLTIQAGPEVELRLEELVGRRVSRIETVRRRAERPDRSRWKTRQASPVGAAS